MNSPEIQTHQHLAQHCDAMRHAVTKEYEDVVVEYVNEALGDGMRALNGRRCSRRRDVDDDREGTGLSLFQIEYD